MAILIWRGTDGPHYMKGPTGQYPDGVPHSVVYSKGTAVAEVPQGRYRSPRGAGGFYDFYWSPLFFAITAVDASTTTIARFQVQVLNDELQIFCDGLPTSNPGNPGQLWNDGGTLKVSS